MNRPLLHLGYKTSYTNSFLTYLEQHMLEIIALSCVTKVVCYTQLLNFPLSYLSSQLAQVVIACYHRLSNLNDRFLFLTMLEVKKPDIRVSDLGSMKAFSWLENDCLLAVSPMAKRQGGATLLKSYKPNMSQRLLLFIPSH